jgi:hypothetical protein
MVNDPAIRYMRMQNMSKLLQIYHKLFNNYLVHRCAKIIFSCKKHNSGDFFDVSTVAILSSAQFTTLSRKLDSCSG